MVLNLANCLIGISVKCFLLSCWKTCSWQLFKKVRVNCIWRFARVNDYIRGFPDLLVKLYDWNFWLNSFWIYSLKFYVDTLKKKKKKGVKIKGGGGFKFLFKFVLKLYLKFCPDSCLNLRLVASLSSLLSLFFMSIFGDQVAICWLPKKKGKKNQL